MTTTEPIRTENDEKFPYVQCTECEISYGAFKDDVARQCPHCGRGLLMQLFAEDEGYRKTGPETAGNAKMHETYSREQAARRQG